MPGKNPLSSAWKKLKTNVLLRRLLTVVSLDILVKASSLLLLPVYLRLMTQDEYGIFNYILSIAYSFSVLLNLGLYIPQSKLYHDFPDLQDKGKLIYTINLLLLGSLFFLVLPIYFFGLDFHAVHFLFKNSIHYGRYRWWILLLTLTSLFAYMLTNFFYTAEKINLIKRYSLSRVIGINTVSILALFILRRRDAIEVRFIAIAGVELVLLLFFYHPYARGMIRTGDRRLMLRCLKLALPVMLSSLFGIVINFGDKFFLEKYFNYKVLSVYYLACSCASAISLLSISLQNVWLPLFFKEKDLEKNFAKTNRMVLRLVWILAILSILIMTVVICALQWNIIPKAYQDIVFLLPLQLAGQIVIFLALLYSNYLIYFEKTSLILWSGLLVSTISTLLNMTLIPIFGAYGAATTLLVSNGSYLLIYYNIIAYYRKRHLLSKLTA